MNYEQETAGNSACATSKTKTKTKRKNCEIEADRSKMRDLLSKGVDPDSLRHFFGWNKKKANEELGSIAHFLASFNKSELKSRFISSEHQISDIFENNDLGFCEIKKFKDTENRIYYGLYPCTSDDILNK